MGVRIYERMLRKSVGKNLIVRVWIAFIPSEPVALQLVVAALEDLISQLDEHLGPFECAKKIADYHQSVNAVEVLFKDNGNGVLVYNDWP